MTGLVSRAGADATRIEPEGDSHRPAEAAGTPLHSAAVSVLALAALFLWGPVLAVLWNRWRNDEALSHGPILLLLVLGMLWLRRADLRRWESASRGGLTLMIATSVIHVASWWTDVVFLQSLSLFAMTLGTIWYLGGKGAARSAAGPIGLLVFAIPSPTTLIDRIAFPLQMMSTAYAGIVAGLFGLPIHRDGVTLSVMPNPHAPPIYSVMVAKGCSGLTSLTVLLALGYFIAYHTPGRLAWRAVLVALVVPLALLGNTLRITFVLLAGAYYSPHLAETIHDNEAPMLMLFCTLALLLVRNGLSPMLQPAGRRPHDPGAAGARRGPGAGGSNAGLALIEENDANDSEEVLL